MMIINDLILVFMVAGREGGGVVSRWRGKGPMSDRRWGAQVVGVPAIWRSLSFPGRLRKLRLRGWSGRREQQWRHWMQLGLGDTLSGSKPAERPWGDRIHGWKASVTWPGKCWSCDPVCCLLAFGVKLCSRKYFIDNFTQMELWVMVTLTLWDNGNWGLGGHSEE